MTMPDRIAILEMALTSALHVIRTQIDTAQWSYPDLCAWAQARLSTIDVVLHQPEMAVLDAEERQA